MLIQTGAIGDIVIALPIAHWFYKQGHDVFWPIDSSFLEYFSYAAPYVNFLPVDVSQYPKGTYHYFIGVPEAWSRQLQITNVFYLYSYMTGIELPNRETAKYLKFDEYKYAATGVPFREKWNLNIRRNEVSEKNLLEKIWTGRPFCIIHDTTGAGMKLQKNLKEEFPEERYGEHIHVSPLTKSPLDWILAFERAQTLVMIDSVHANIVEQIGIDVDKYLYPHAQGLFHPVYMSGWHVRE